MNSISMKANPRLSGVISQLKSETLIGVEQDDRRAERKPPSSEPV